MPYLQTPTGRYLEAPEGMSYEAALEKARAKYPQDFGIKPQEGFGANFKKAGKDYLEQYTGAVTEQFDPELGRAALARNAADQSVRATQWEDVKDAYRQRGLFGDEQGPGGLSSLGAFTRDTAAQSLPAMGATIAGARVGAIAGGLSPIPGGALIGGGIGALAANLPMFAGQNLQTQIEEQKTRGVTEPLNRGAAWGAAAGQGALDAGSTYLMLGKLGFGKAIGKSVDDMLKKSAQEAEKEAVETAKRSLMAAGARGAGKGIAVEMPTETAQTVLERWQAGQELFSPDALRAYEASAAGAVVLGGPLGGVGGVHGRSEARTKVEETQRAADAKTALEARKTEEAYKQTPAYLQELSTNFETLTAKRDELGAQRAAIRKQRNDKATPADVKRNLIRQAESLKLQHETVINELRPIAKEYSERSADIEKQRPAPPPPPPAPFTQQGEMFPTEPPAPPPAADPLRDYLSYAQPQGQLFPDAPGANTLEPREVVAALLARPDLAKQVLEGKELFPGAPDKEQSTLWKTELKKQLAAASAVRLPTEPAAPVADSTQAYQQIIADREAMDKQSLAADMADGRIAAAKQRKAEQPPAWYTGDVQREGNNQLRNAEALARQGIALYAPKIAAELEQGKLTPLGRKAIGLTSVSGSGTFDLSDRDVAKRLLPVVDEQLAELEKGVSSASAFDLVDERGKLVDDSYQRVLARINTLNRIKERIEPLVGPRTFRKPPPGGESAAIGQVAQTAVTPVPELGNESAAKPLEQAQEAYNLQFENLMSSLDVLARGEYVPNRQKEVLRAFMQKRAKTRAGLDTARAAEPMGPPLEAREAATRISALAARKAAVQGATAEEGAKAFESEAVLEAQNAKPALVEAAVKRVLTSRAQQGLPEMSPGAQRAIARTISSAFDALVDRSRRKDMSPAKRVIVERTQMRSGKPVRSEKAIMSTEQRARVDSDPYYGQIYGAPWERGEGGKQADTFTDVVQRFEKLINSFESKGGPAETLEDIDNARMGPPEPPKAEVQLRSQTEESLAEDRAKARGSERGSPAAQTLQHVEQTLGEIETLLVPRPANKLKEVVSRTKGTAGLSNLMYENYKAKQHNAGRQQLDPQARALFGKVQQFLDNLGPGSSLGAATDAFLGNVDTLVEQARNTTDVDPALAREVLGHISGVEKAREGEWKESRDSEGKKKFTRHPQGELFGEQAYSAPTAAEFEQKMQGPRETAALRKENAEKTGRLKSEMAALQERSAKALAQGRRLKAEAEQQLAENTKMAERAADAGALLGDLQDDIVRGYGQETEPKDLEALQDAVTAAREAVARTTEAFDNVTAQQAEADAALARMRTDISGLEDTAKKLASVNSAETANQDLEAILRNHRELNDAKAREIGHTRRYVANLRAAVAANDAAMQAQKKRKKSTADFRTLQVLLAERLEKGLDDATKHFERIEKLFTIRPDARSNLSDILPPEVSPPSQPKPLPGGTTVTKAKVVTLPIVVTRGKGDKAETHELPQPTWSGGGEKSEPKYVEGVKTRVVTRSTVETLENQKQTIREREAAKRADELITLRGLELRKSFGSAVAADRAYEKAVAEYTRVREAGMPPAYAGETAKQIALRKKERSKELGRSARAAKNALDTFNEKSARYDRAWELAPELAKIALEETQQEAGGDPARLRRPISAKEFAQTMGEAMVASRGKGEQSRKGIPSPSKGFSEAALRTASKDRAPDSDAVGKPPDLPLPKRKDMSAKGQTYNPAEKNEQVRQERALAAVQPLVDKLVEVERQRQALQETMDGLERMANEGASAASEEAVERQIRDLGREIKKAHDGVDRAEETLDHQVGKVLSVRDRPGVRLLVKQQVAGALKSKKKSKDVELEAPGGPLAKLKAWSSREDFKPETSTELYLAKRSGPIDASAPFHKMSFAQAAQWGADNSASAVRKAMFLKLADRLKDDGGVVYGRFGTGGLFMSARSAISVSNTSAKRNEILLHELTHAATYAALRTDPEFQGRVESLRTRVVAWAVSPEGKAYVRSRGMNLKEKASHAGADVGNVYGLKNADEFLAETFSRREFQKMLAQIESETKGRSVWSKLVDFIVKALGLDSPHMRSALNDALELVHEGMDIETTSYMSDVSLSDANDVVEKGVELPSPPTYASGDARALQDIDGRLISQQSPWRKAMFDHVMGFRAHFIDAFDPLVKLSTRMDDSVEATQMMYYLRMFKQASNATNEIALNGTLKLEKITRPDGRTEWMVKSENGDNLRTIAEVLRDAGVGDLDATDRRFKSYMIAERAFGGNAPEGYDSVVGFLPKGKDGEARVSEAELRSVWEFGKGNTAFQKARAMSNRYHNGLLDFLEQTGAMSAEKVAELKSKGNYVSFYRRDGDKINLIVNGERIHTVGSIKSQPSLQRLVGSTSPITGFLEGALQNTRLLTEMALKNLATRNVAETLKGSGWARIGNVKPTGGPEGSNVIHFRAKGVDKYAVIDTDATGIPTELLVAGLDGVAVQLPAAFRFMGVPARLLRQFIVRNPLYAARQVVRDSTANWLLAGVDGVPVADQIKEIGKMIAGRSDAERDLQKRLITGGQALTGDMDDRATILKQIGSGKLGWQSAMAKLDFWAMQADAAARVTAYNSAIANGMTDMEATLAALETMNFNRRGMSPFMHAMGTMIPFMNAQIQGLDVLYRAFKGDMPFNERLKIRDKLITRGAMMFASTVAYASMMQDDEDYQNASMQDKLANWYLPTPWGTLRIPTPFEAGYLFKALPEAIVNVANDDKKAGEVLSAFGQFGLNSIPGILPQGIKPAIESVMNREFYTGRDIEDARMQGLKASERYGDRTTEIAKALGGSFEIAGREIGMSPAKIEHLVRGYTGALGVALLGLADGLMATGGSERPTRKLNETPILGPLFVEKDASAAVSEAYKMIEQYGRAKSTFEKMVGEGRQEDAEKFAEKFGDQIAKAEVSNQIKSELGQLTKLEQQIRTAPKMSGDEKRSYLDEVRKAKIAVSRMALEALR